MSEQRMEQVWAMLTSYATEYGLKVLGAILILIIGYSVAKILGRAAYKSLRKSRLDNTLVKFLSGITRFAIILFSWIAALETFGIETTSFVAVLGAAGFAVGLALQGSLSNFSSGVMLLFLKPFSAGDYIQVAGNEGTVEEIGILATIINTSDNKRVIIPNSAVFSSTIVSFTGNPTRMIDLPIAVDYQNDLNKVREVLLATMRKNPLILAEPAPVVEVASLGSDAVHLTLRSWVKTEDFWTAYFALNQSIKEDLAENGIVAPVPQQNVHIYQATPS